MVPTSINIHMADIDYNQMTEAFVRALRTAGNSGNHINPGNPSGERSTSSGAGRGDLGNPNWQRQQKQQEAMQQGTIDGLKSLNKELKNMKAGQLGRRSQELTKMSQAASNGLGDLNKQFKSSADAMHFWHTRTGKGLLRMDREAEKLRKTLAKTTLTADERIETEKKLLKVEQDRTEQMDKHFGKNGRWWTKALGGLAVVAGAAGKHIYDDMRNQMGSAGIGGFMSQVGEGWLRAVDPSELTRMSKDYRAAQISMMGTSGNTLEIFEAAGRIQGELTTRTKNATEATELYAASAQSLVASGIKPSEKAILAQIKAGDKLAKISGMTALEFAKLNQRLAEEGDMRYLMQSTLKTERGQRRDMFTQLIAYNRQQGMLQEQAERAAIALGAMAAESPLERMKKGARLAAAAGALGISGGNEMRQMMMRGGPQTAAEAQQASDFLAQMSQQRQAARQRGDFGAELMIDRLLTGLDLEKTLGKGSEFNRELGEQAKVPDKIADSMQLTSDSMASSLGLTTAQFGEAVHTFDIAVNTWKNFGVGSAVSGLMGSLGGGALGGTIAGRMMQGKGFFEALNPFSSGGKSSGSFGRMMKSPAIAGRGAMGLMGTAGAAAGAGLVGYGAGTLAYESNFLGTKTGANFAVGNIMNGIDSIRGFFGDEEAGQRAEMWRKSQEEKMTEQTTAANEQVAEAKTTNELLAEQNALARANLELQQGGAAAIRLAETRANSQGNLLAGQH